MAWKQTKHNILPSLQPLKTQYTHARTYSTPSRPLNMPLVVPGLMGKSGASDDSSKWQEQLMGKKLGDVSDNTVRHNALFREVVG